VVHLKISGHYPDLNHRQNDPNCKMDNLRELLGLGLQPKDLGILQVTLRGIIVFLVTLGMLRAGHRRFMSRMTAFDAVLGVLLASVLARAINGSAPFGPTLIVGLVLVLLHRIFSALAFYWGTFGTVVKGRSDVLVEGGKPDKKKLRTHKISQEDLLEEARLNGRISELSRIRQATLERNGKISIIPVQE
jgi:uncharacterized membrane protein YcaP (DUF421 family)